MNKQRFRQCTVLYYLQANGSNVRVCKTCFLKTFDLNGKFIETVLNKKRVVLSGIITLDHRGNHTNKKKTSDEEIQNTRNHILSIRLYESLHQKRHQQKIFTLSLYAINALQRLQNCVPTLKIM